jgi:hypothetical protein
MGHETTELEAKFRYNQTGRVWEWLNEDLSEKKRQRSPIKFNLPWKQSLSD